MLQLILLAKYFAQQEEEQQENQFPAAGKCKKSEKSDHADGHRTKGINVNSERKQYQRRDEAPDDPAENRDADEEGDRHGISQGGFEVFCPPCLAGRFAQTMSELFGDRFCRRCIVLIGEAVLRIKLPQGTSPADEIRPLYWWGVGSSVR